MHPRSTVSRAALLGGTVALLAASSLPRRTSAADLIPLRIGVPPTDATGEGFYGVDKGFYADAGLDVHLQPMFNGEAMSAALSAGSLDVITGTVVPVAQAFTHGIDERVIAPGLIYDRGQGQSVVVVVATNSPALKAVDLNGKTIAVNGLGDLTHLALLAWLGTNGADLKSVKLLEVPFPAVGPALDQGRIDAALLVEPFITGLKGKVRVIGDTMAVIGPRFIGTVWVSKLDWLNQNREAARRFATATSKIAAWANAHQDETATILSKYTNIPVATINSLNRAVYDTSPAVGTLLQPILDAQSKYFGVPRITGASLIWSG
jgi:NitT/TauT family transport system substrate-binding protein